MLYLTVPSRERFDEATSTFSYTKEENLQLEHSLVSLSKWESKWEKPFLSKDKKTTEEIIDYIKCMTITQNVKPEVYDNLPKEVFTKVDAYIHAKMTATWFSDKQNTPQSREVITAELIYYWMVAHNIPFECQKWHLSRLLTLIKVCNIKNQPQKKMGRKEMLHSRAALNAARRTSMNTKG